MVIKLSRTQNMLYRQKVSRVINCICICIVSMIVLVFIVDYRVNKDLGRSEFGIVAASMDNDNLNLKFLREYDVDLNMKYIKKDIEQMYMVFISVAGWLK